MLREIALMSAAEARHAAALSEALASGDPDRIRLALRVSRMGRQGRTLTTGLAEAEKLQGRRPASTPVRDLCGSREGFREYRSRLGRGEKHRIKPADFSEVPVQQARVLDLRRIEVLLEAGQQLLSVGLSVPV